MSDQCIRAAYRGNLRLLQHLRAAGSSWNQYTCAAAAAGGHLELLKWARAHGATWDVWTCAEAARHGHLRLLLWARAHGAPFIPLLCARAAYNNAHPVVATLCQSFLRPSNTTPRELLYYSHALSEQPAALDDCVW